MQLTQNQIRFITNNRQILEGIFKTRVDELTGMAMRMKEGMDRDVTIRFVQEFTRWVSDMDNFKEELNIGKSDPHI